VDSSCGSAVEDASKDELRVRKYVDSAFHSYFFLHRHLLTLHTCMRRAQLLRACQQVVLFSVQGSAQQILGETTVGVRSAVSATAGGTSWIKLATTEYVRVQD